ncbi:MAG TPA: hypothetical protein PKJ79_08670 [Quisquiliibacterium sp.]|nr:hypothetical protein [Quisquiliibacterium sp.]
MSPAQAAAGRAAHPMKGVALLVCAICSFTLLDATAKHLSATYPVPLIVWARYFFHVVLLALLFGPRMGTASCAPGVR